MPKAFPREFHEGVVRVYRDSDAAVAQVAKDFGISPSCLKPWLVIDDRRSANPFAGRAVVNEADALGGTSGSSSWSRSTRCPSPRSQGPQLVDTAARRTPVYGASSSPSPLRLRFCHVQDGGRRRRKYGVRVASTRTIGS
jgi:hypothetical protein